MKNKLVMTYHAINYASTNLSKPISYQKQYLGCVILPIADTKIFYSCLP